MEKRSPTVKKYEKEIGKLYWHSVSIYDEKEEGYFRGYNLIMVSEMHRWGKGTWFYKATTLHNVNPEGGGFNLSFKCIDFLDNNIKIFPVPADGSKPRWNGMGHADARAEERADKTREKMQRSKIGVDGHNKKV